MKTPEAAPSETPGFGGGAPALAHVKKTSASLPIRSRVVLTMGAFGALTVAACLTAPLVGGTPISLIRALDRSIPFADNVDAQIFFIARLPRVLAGALVGASLAASGVVFQAMLRNPLATPFTLGVSAGSSLGAMIAITFGTTFGWGPFSPVPLASLAGASIAASLVYWLATPSGRAMSTSVLLLAGVTLNSFFSALIMFVQYVADFAQIAAAFRWLMGDLDVGSFEPLWAAMPLLLAAFIIFALLPSSLNLISLGNDAAASRGVDVARAQRLAFVSASMATSAAVSIAGPIGFVGIVVPHLVRLIVGVDHRLVLPASALFGATFLVACDVLSRTLFPPVEIPVGVVTALIGGPFFLWLLVRRG
jgi:iron complex transport system permease protein